MSKIFEREWLITLQKLLVEWKRLIAYVNIGRRLPHSKMADVENNTSSEKRKRRKLSVK